jgi:hypothetical protein
MSFWRAHHPPQQRSAALSHQRRPAAHQYRQDSQFREVEMRSPQRQPVPQFGRDKTNFSGPGLHSAQPRSTEGLVESFPRNTRKETGDPNSAYASVRETQASHLHAQRVAILDDHPRVSQIGPNLGNAPVSNAVEFVPRPKLASAGFDSTSVDTMKFVQFLWQNRVFETCNFPSVISMAHAIPPPRHGTSRPSE